MSELTDTQLRALRWLEENEQTRSQWLHNGKTSKAKQEWTHMKVSGPTGSIVMTSADQAAIRDFTKVNTDLTVQKFFVANARGKGLLARIS